MVELASQQPGFLGVESAREEAAPDLAVLSLLCRCLSSRGSGGPHAIRVVFMDPLDMAALLGWLGGVGLRLWELELRELVHGRTEAVVRY